MVLAYRARIPAVICRRGLLLPSLHALSLTLALAGIATGIATGVAIAVDVLLIFVLLGRTTGGLSASYISLVDVYVVATAVAVAVVVDIVAIAFSASGGWTFGGPC